MVWDFHSEPLGRRSRTPSGSPSSQSTRSESWRAGPERRFARQELTEGPVAGAPSSVRALLKDQACHLSSPVAKAGPRGVICSSLNRFLFISVFPLIRKICQIKWPDVREVIKTTSSVAVPLCKEPTIHSLKFANRCRSPLVWDCPYLPITGAGTWRASPHLVSPLRNRIKFRR